MARLNYVFDWASVRKALAGRTRMPVTHVSESVTMVNLPGDVVRLIGVAPRTEGMYIESIARAGHDEYLYFQQIYVPPTRRRLHIVTHTHREPERRTEIAPAPSPQEPPS